MKIYISASFAARLRLRPMRDCLFAMGHDVTSSWLDEVARSESMDQEVFDKKLAIKDLVEAGSADLLIQDTFTPSTTGGLHVEWGIALGRFQRQQLWLVGPIRNVFHRLYDLQFADWGELFEWIDPQVGYKAVKLEESVAMAETEWLEREGNND